MSKEGQKEFLSAMCPVFKATGSFQKQQVVQEERPEPGAGKAAQQQVQFQLLLLRFPERHCLRSLLHMRG
jgi:hypothetical protein